MSRDFFLILGLKPRRYERSEITRRFAALRGELLAALGDPTRHVEARQRLNELHRAHNVLRNPQRQAEHLRLIRPEGEEPDRVTRLRHLIEASLEDGLLRCSRRAEILAEGRRLGFSDFHTQLLIAQVQFGEGIVVPPYVGDCPACEDSAPRVRARFAAAGLLALAIFLAMIRWLGA